MAAFNWYSGRSSAIASGAQVSNPKPNANTADSNRLGSVRVAGLPKE